MPNTPTIPFIVVIHRINSDIVSAVKLPTIGINLLIENLAAFNINPSAELDNKPYIFIIADKSVIIIPIVNKENFLMNLDSLFT